jgi:tRNA-splicing endonuclease subunit Sen54
MPSLYEIAALFDKQPEVPPPPPRQRRQTNKPTPSVPSVISVTPKRTFFQIFTRAFWSPAATGTSPRKPNPFIALKAGKKNVIIAAVDSGNISFFRLGEGAFSEWPMT